MVALFCLLCKRTQDTVGICVCVPAWRMHIGVLHISMPRAVFIEMQQQRPLQTQDQQPLGIWFAGREDPCGD